MSEEIIACDIGAELDEVIRLMRQHRVRRIPITEDGRPVGLITFDDLVLDGAIGLDDLRSIVTASSKSRPRTRRLECYIRSGQPAPNSELSDERAL